MKTAWSADSLRDLDNSSVLLYLEAFSVERFDKWQI